MRLTDGARGESATAADKIFGKALVLISDSATIDDSITKRVLYSVSDLTTVNESTLLKGAILIEIRDQNDKLMPGFNYTISPNPFTGTSYLNVSDGGAGDNGTYNDGLIKVYYVPLGLYRINQTAVPTGNYSLYNFTYTTVHLTDINATALFRAVNFTTTDLTQEAPISADILDIDSPPGFDFITASANLTKVRNGTKVPITEVTDMPAPIFAGVSNASSIGNATADQYSLVYQNMNLTTNETPQNIREAFNLTQYDAGSSTNSTNSTFVGVFTATQGLASGQYVATQPFDKFNCGQEYIFTLDDTLVPSFGGMTRAEFTLNSSGTCPAAEDYNTFEIASVPPAGSGILESIGLL